MGRGRIGPDTQPKPTGVQKPIPTLALVPILLYPYPPQMGQVPVTVTYHEIAILMSHSSRNMVLNVEDTYIIFF